MKKILKIIVATIAILLCIVFLFLQYAVPPIAKSYIEKHSKEFVGRNILIGDFSWNLPSINVTLKDLKVLEQDDSTEFVGFDYMNVDISPLALITKKAKLESFTLKGLRATVLQSGDRFNFTDILEFLAKNAVADSTADSAKVTVETTDSSAAFVYTNPVPELPIDVEINNIDISGVTLHYKDLQKGMELNVQNAGVHIPTVYLDANATNIKIEAAFPEGGKFDLAVKFGIATGDFDVKMNLDRFALSNAFSIAKTIVQIDSLEGLLSLNVETAGTLNDLLAGDVNGSVKLEKFAVRETAGGRYSINNFETAFTGVNLKTMKLPIDVVTVEGVNGHFDMFKGGKTNIDKLLAASTDNMESNDSLAQALVASADSTVTEVQKDSAKVTTSETSAKQELPDFYLKKLNVSNVTFTLNDYTIVRPLHYTVNNVSVNGSDISMKTANIKAHVGFQESGTLDLTFKGVPEQLMTMKIQNASVNVDLKNMALKPFSPYSIHYTGYPLSSGTMNVDSKSTIVNNKLTSNNSVLIDKINVDDKDKTVKPEFTVPMKVGLYVLKDRHDQIKIDMPVEGSLDDPQFSVIKVVWKTFCNLMLKVALTPTKVIAAPLDAITGDKKEDPAQ